MGRRIGAYFLDALLGLVIVGGLSFGVMAATKPFKHLTAPTDKIATDFCNNFNDHTGYGGQVRDQYGNRICFTSGSDVYLAKPWPVFGPLIGLSLVWGIINFVLIEGAKGGTVGKLMVGIRVVGSDGSICGMGRALGRNAILQLPSAIPFLGWLWQIAMLIVAAANSEHRHLGDMGAGTYVIDKAAVGHPVHPSPSGFAGYAPPGQGSYTAPAQPPSQAAATSPVSQPQWDQARNTYIWWNPEQQQWLEHDQASDQWRPISQ